MKNIISHLQIISDRLHTRMIQHHINRFLDFCYSVTNTSPFKEALAHTRTYNSCSLSKQGLIYLSIPFSFIGIYWHNSHSPPSSCLLCSSHYSLTLFPTRLHLTLLFPLFLFFPFNFSFPRSPLHPFHLLIWPPPPRLPPGHPAPAYPDPGHLDPGHPASGRVETSLAKKEISNTASAWDWKRRFNFNWQFSSGFPAGVPAVWNTFHSWDETYQNLYVDVSWFQAEQETGF